LYAPLYTVPGAAIPAVLEQLAPTIYGDALMARRDSWYLVSGAIDEQLSVRRGLGSARTAQSITDPSGRTVWLAGLGQFSNVSSNNTAGYSNRIGGTAAGVDVVVTPALTAGAAFGFSNQSVSAKNSASFSGDLFQFELYGSLHQGMAFLDMQAGGGFSEGTATRPQMLYGVQASGKMNGAAGGGSIRGGVQLDAGAWRIEPSVSLAGVSLTQGALGETMGGPVGMSVGSASIGSLQTLIGARAERRIAIGTGVAVVSSAQIGWLHEYLDTAASTTASLLGTAALPFAAQSAEISRNAAVLGVRAVVETNSPLAVYASYTGALRSSGSAQSVSAGIRFVW
jgi:outer membrane autotransporter protein